MLKLISFLSFLLALSETLFYLYAVYTQYDNFNNTIIAWIEFRLIHMFLIDIYKTCVNENENKYVKYFISFFIFMDIVKIIWAIIILNNTMEIYIIYIWVLINIIVSSLEILFILLCIFITVLKMMCCFENDNYKIINYDSSYLFIHENNECLICHISYELNDSIRILSCNHNFHNKCWVQLESNICPCCNGNTVINYTYTYKFKYDNNECSICQSTFVEDDKIKILSCGHSFHEACIDVWIYINNICPLCISKIN